MLTSDEINKLIEKAKKARENAFVPRSSHKIGACVLTTSGEYFEGCNIEGIISGLGTCAERAAIDHAVVHGHYQFKAIAALDEKLTYPCGTCLQYLLQFYQINGKDIAILTADEKGKIKVNSIFEMLPFGYITHHNLNKLKSYHNK